jgi:hypothetical protein
MAKARRTRYRAGIDSYSPASLLALLPTFLATLPFNGCLSYVSSLNFHSSCPGAQCGALRPHGRRSSRAEGHAAIRAAPALPAHGDQLHPQSRRADLVLGQPDEERGRARVRGSVHRRGRAGGDTPGDVQHRHSHAHHAAHTHGASRGCTGNSRSAALLAV